MCHNNYVTHGFLPNLNPIAKVFIISEAFFWSGWNVLLPLISIFALTEVNSATIQTMSFGYSLYLICRVVGSLVSGVFLNKITYQNKIWLIITGILTVNLSYLGFISVTNIFPMFIFFSLAGFCTGLISPVRAALFSTHMDKNQETREWGFLDAIILTAIAACTAISGLLVSQLGYKSVFAFSVALNTLSVFPYFYILHTKSK